MKERRAWGALFVFGRKIKAKKCKSLRVKWYKSGENRREEPRDDVKLLGEFWSTRKNNYEEVTEFGCGIV